MKISKQGEFFLGLRWWNYEAWLWAKETGKLEVSAYIGALLKQTIVDFTGYFLSGMLVGAICLFIVSMYAHSVNLPPNEVPMWCSILIILGVLCIFVVLFVAALLLLGLLLGNFARLALRRYPKKFYVKVE